MKLLLDANLSPKPLASVTDLFPGSAHVFEAGLGPDDLRIWEHAETVGFAIVSKDSDFYRMSAVWGPPPKVVWLKIGNGGTAAAAPLLRPSAETMLRFDADPAAALLIIERP